MAIEWPGKSGFVSRKITLPRLKIVIIKIVYNMCLISLMHIGHEPMDHGSSKDGYVNHL